MENSKSVSVDLSHIKEGLTLLIDARKENTLFDIPDADENNEARYQLIEGCFYDYEFSVQTFHFEKDQIVQPHTRHKHLGTITPNIYVGRLSIPVYCGDKEAGSVELEVQSIKSGYRDDYRDMLEFITERSTDLLMQANSPVSHHFVTDYSKDSKTLYQKYAFIRSILDTDEFTESVHRIVTSPVTQWKETNEINDIRKVRQFGNKNVKEFITASKRNKLPETHNLRSYGLHSVPEKINTVHKTDSVDTPENRFIKHALEVFLKFCSDINKASPPGSRLCRESAILTKILESQLHHSFFREISRPDTLKLNSPVLQRKEGYREVLRVWLMFDLAAKLIWKGGDDVYGGGKKDIATLYEYWLFFKLLDLFKSIFEIEPRHTSELIKETADGLNLQLKQGTQTALSGVFNTGTRKINIRFNYNRSFSGQSAYPQSGSWTTTMRPDYTLSFWPYGITDKEAESQELIVHIHFDAKYKIANLRSLINDAANQDKKTALGIISKFNLKDFSWEHIHDFLIDKGYAKSNNEESLTLLSFFWEEADIESIGDISGDNYTELIEIIQQTLLSEEKEENRKGIYKNADLLKMHAYKDAIRRTSGAYILYPGDTPIKKKGFHEIIPGLGAFPVRPSKRDDGIGELKDFILEIINHFVNRASQREKIAFRTYDVYKNKPQKEDEVNEALPETLGENRSLIPDDTFVLVGFYKKENLDWIINSGLYNARAENNRGSLRLGPGETGAKFILLHTTDETKTGRLLRITETGPRVFSKQTLIDKGYPTEPTQNYYLVYKIREATDIELMNQRWDITLLDKYKQGHGSGLPFSVTLTELMKTKV